VSEGLTVREVERRLRAVPSPVKKKTGRPRAIDRQPAEVRQIEDRLRRHLQTDVMVKVSSGARGTVTMHFYSADDLDRLLELMQVPD